MFNDGAKYVIDSIQPLKKLEYHKLGLVHTYITDIMIVKDYYLNNKEKEGMTHFKKMKFLECDIK